MTLRILLIEDENDFRDALCDILNLEGYVADGVASIASYKAWRKTHECDVLIVDRQLPDGDGLEAIRIHRLTNDSPVIVMTARGETEDRIAGINADADYYLTKPVATSELLALLRRIQRRALALRQPATWILDRVGWRLHVPSGSEVVLTQKEMVFLAHFVERPGMVVSRQEVMKKLWTDPEQVDPRRLEVMVRRLRNKIEDVAGTDLPLATVYGVGYAFNAILGGP